MWNGVLGGGMSEEEDPGRSSEDERIRGVAVSVPHVMSCFIAIGPNSDGVGEGTAGTSEKLSPVGDLGRSTSPQ